MFPVRQESIVEEVVFDYYIILSSLTVQNTKLHMFKS